MPDVPDGWSQSDSRPLRPCMQSITTWATRWVNSVDVSTLLSNLLRPRSYLWRAPTFLRVWCSFSHSSPNFVSLQTSMQRHPLDSTNMLLAEGPSTPRQDAGRPSTSASPPFCASPVSSAPSSPYASIKRRGTYPSSSSSHYSGRLRSQSTNRQIPSLSHLVPVIDHENDRLARACGLLPPMSYSGRSSASRSHQKRSYTTSSDDSDFGSPPRKVPPYASKIHHTRLLSVLAKLLHAQRLEMRDLVTEEEIRNGWEKDLSQERMKTEDGCSGEAGA